MNTEAVREKLLDQNIELYLENITFDRYGKVKSTLKENFEIAGVSAKRTEDRVSFLRALCVNVIRMELEKRYLTKK